MTSLSSHKVGATCIASGNYGVTFGGSNTKYYLTQEDTDVLIKITTVPCVHSLRAMPRIIIYPSVLLQ